jgi:hypothetical protein
MLRQIKLLLDRSDTFPISLQTEARGSLRLTRSHMEIGGKVYCRFCSYGAEKNGNEPAASFHPRTYLPANTSRWSRIFDRRYVAVMDTWRNQLLRDEARIRSRLEFWLPAEISYEDFLAGLRLKSISVSQDETSDVSLSWRSLDFGVSFDRKNRITSIEVIGG